MAFFPCLQPYDQDDQQSAEKKKICEIKQNETCQGHPESFSL